MIFSFLQLNIVCALSLKRERGAQYPLYGRDGLCQGRDFIDCCPDVNWPFWYPDQPLRDLKAVQTVAFGPPLRPEQDENRRDARWRSRYSCLDTESLEQMQLREGAADIAEVTRKLSSWPYVCPYSWVMERKGPFEAKYDKSVPVWIDECIPPDLVDMLAQSSTARMYENIARGPIRRGSVDCFDATVLDARTTRIEVAVSKSHSVKVLASEDKRKHDLAGYISAAYMTLVDLTKVRDKGEIVRPESWVQGLVEFDVQVGHTYQGCAKAPWDTDITLRLAATGTTFDIMKSKALARYPWR